MFLVPTGIITALIARETTGAGPARAHVAVPGRAALHDADLVVGARAGPAFYGTMAKTYPPGVHQEMIFEVADNEYVHASIMSGLAPVKTQDAILGLPDPSDPEKYMMLSPEERAELTPKRRAAYKQRERDGLIAEFRENNHAIEAIESMEYALGERRTASAARRQRHDRDGRRSGARAHDAGRRADPHGLDARRDPRDRGRCPASTTTRSSASSATRPPRSRSSRGSRDPRARGDGVMHALEGVRLIDFGQYLAGPFGPMVIGDLGADVIKVEPVTGDGMRMASQPFFGCQRGKRDIALDLKSERGHEIALQLVERADIVHHNMTAGVAVRLGIGYEDCKRVKPEIVYCNTWAYGLEGPLARFGGLDPLYQASAGLEYEQGPVREGNTPNYLRFGMTDTANAMLSVVGCLAALYHQRVTGEGQELWTSLLDGGSMFASDAMLVDGEAVPRPRLDKAQTGTDALYRLVRDAGRLDPDRGDRRRALGGVVRRARAPELASDPRFATAAARAENRRQLETLLEPRFVTRTAIVWSRWLDAAGVPNEIAIDPKAGERVLFDGDNERLGLVAEYDHPLLGRMRQYGTFIDFSETPGLIHGPPPLVGEHTVEILEWLGYSQADMDELKAQGVVYWPDDNYAWTT